MSPTSASHDVSVGLLGTAIRLTSSSCLRVPASRSMRWRRISLIARWFTIVASRGMPSRLPAVIEQTCAAGHELVEPVLLATAEADWNRLVFLLFEGDADRPTAVLKLPRTAGCNDAVEHEHAVLRDVS